MSAYTQERVWAYEHHEYQKTALISGWLGWGCTFTEERGYFQHGEAWVSVEGRTKKKILFFMKSLDIHIVYKQMDICLCYWQFMGSPLEKKNATSEEAIITLG